MTHITNMDVYIWLYDYMCSYIYITYIHILYDSSQRLDWNVSIWARQQLWTTLHPFVSNGSHVSVKVSEMYVLVCICKYQSYYVLCTCIYVYIYPHIVFMPSWVAEIDTRSLYPWDSHTKHQRYSRRGFCRRRTSCLEGQGPATRRRS